MSPAILVALLPLAVLVSIPFLRPYLNKLKLGNLEVEFLKLPEGDQHLLFLESIAREREWTFYAKRETEGQIGEAFLSLIRNLQLKDEEKLYAKLKTWLDSGVPNLIWFASEVIGYFEIEELRDELLSTIQTSSKSDDFNKRWPTWALNCKWASSIFDNFTSLNRFLLGTSNRQNQQWLLEAYEQMLEAYPADEDPERWGTLRRGLQEFTNRATPLKSKAQDLLKRSESGQLKEAASQPGDKANTPAENVAEVLNQPDGVARRSAGSDQPGDQAKSDEADSPPGDHATQKTGS